MESSNSTDFLSLLASIPEEMRFWLLLLLIIASILIIYLFRQEIGGLIKRISNIRYGKEGFTVSFSRNIQQARQQKNQNAHLTGIDRTGVLPDTDRPSLSSRDLVLEAWASLKQNIYDACVARKISLTIATNPLEALNRLKLANVISTDQYDHIALLVAIGRQVVDSTNFPSKKDAVIYHELVFDVLDWMMSNAFSNHIHKIPTNSRKTEAILRKFSLPSQGKPSVKLIAVNGPQKGRQFNMEKVVFRIGKNPNNDLQIVGDNFVSDIHAQLRYDNGNILLSDMNSKNGTFLNEVKLKVNDNPMSINTGDRIKVGHSVFEIN